MSLTQVMPNGKEHGLINTVANSVPDSDFKRFAEKDRENLRKQKKEDEKIVKAQYLNADGTGRTLERPYMKYEGQPITSWKFVHGHVYEVPQGLINEVNDPMYRRKRRTGLLNAQNKPLLSDEWDDPQHRFVPPSF